MLTTANPFDAMPILDGIRRWVEIETPTEAPGQVNRLASMVADGYRDLPVDIERIDGNYGCGDHLVARSGNGAHTHYEQMYISSIEPRARLLHRLYQTLR